MVCPRVFFDITVGTGAPVCLAAVMEYLTAGEIVAIRDKTAGEIKAILEAAKRIDEFIVEPSVEAVLRPLKEVEGPGIESIFYAAQ